MADEWFYAKDGQQAQGPISAAQLKQLAAGGQVGVNDLVWKQGMPQWVPANQLKGLLGGSTEQRAMPSGTRLPAGEPAPIAPAPPTPAAGDRDQPGRGGEPWYYAFLEKYTRIAMYLGLTLTGIGFLGALIQVFAIAFAEGRGSLGVLIAIVALAVSVLIFGLMALLVAFQAGLILLVLDMGRSLRGIRSNTSER